MNGELSPNRDDLTKEYATDEIVVEWQPRSASTPATVFGRCRRCSTTAGVRGFRWTRRRPARSRLPWRSVLPAPCVPVDAALSGVGHAEAPEVRASADGPLLVSGGVRVTDAAGNVLYEGERAALCRCGGSSNKPFCDGTHKKTASVADGVLTLYQAEWCPSRLRCEKC